MTTKIRRKRIRARLVNGTEALRDWGYGYERLYYVIDALGIAKQEDWQGGWFAVNPETLKLPDGELVVAISNETAGATKLDYNPYERYIIEFCDQNGTVIDTVR
jgi:hypothetical protein